MKNLYIPYNHKLLEIARENRKNPTPAEEKIWREVLQKKQFKNHKFLRQKPLHNFIADFYCAELMLVIEIDGEYHIKQKEYDVLRSDKLKEYGIRVIRYKNKDVLDNIERVREDLEKLLTHPQSLPYQGGRSVFSPDKGD
jgi:very-short-patch-repair endonuclease